MLCGTWASCVALVVKNLHANAGDLRDAGSIPGSGKSPGGFPGGLGNPLQYSCLENPMDKGAWPATGHGVRESRTALKQLSTHILDPYLERKLLGWRGCTHMEQTASAIVTLKRIWKTSNIIFN